MTKSTLAFLTLAILISGCVLAQPTAKPTTDPSPTRTEACFVLGRDDVRVNPDDFKKLKRPEIQKRLTRLTARTGKQPGFKSMLACIMRRTAG